MRLCRTISLLLLVSTYSFAATPDRIAGAISSSQTVQLRKSLHPKAQLQYDQGAVDPELKFSYVTLQTSPSASQQKALNRLLAEQQNPASANYHRWLTPEQYGERFGLSQNDINKITTWLKVQGFTVISVAPGRNSVIVSGTAGQFERAFQTEIHRYDVDGESHIANATPLKMPAAWSGIVTGVRGLHNFSMKPLGVRRMPGLHPFYFDPTFNILIAPGDVATIYDIGPLYDTGFDGTGQKLAVVGQTDVYLADLADFRTGFGLSAISGCTTNASGVVTACNSSNFRYFPDPNLTDPGAPSTCGDLSEADLDIEWSGATARGAQIVYVNSAATFDAQCNNLLSGGVEDALSVAIQNNVAPVVSMSYGICEAFASDDETELQQANTQGMTIVNSSGDVGAAGCDFSPPNTTRPFSPAVLGQAVSYPASSPEVTGVGGTHIPLSEFTPQYWANVNGPNDGTALSYVPEVAWNDDSELALYCQTHVTDSFCKQGGSTARTGWVALGASATAAQVQQDIWISSGGGGPSTCWNETAQGVCIAGFPKPAWQTVTISGQSTRLVPDVSLMASPNFPGFIYCTPLSELGGTGSTSSCATSIQDAVDNDFSIVGGTSVSAPVFAGMVAILNQYLGNTSGMGNANPMLYQLAAVTPNAPDPAFHDVTSGNNIVACKAGAPTNQTSEPNIQCPMSGSLGYSAGVGYDLATGLGSVGLNSLAVAWKTPPNFTVGSSGGINVFAGQSGTATITVNPVNSFGQAVAFSCSGLPAGTTCSFNPTTVTPPGTTTSVMTVQTSGTTPAATGSFSVVGTAGVLSQVSRTASESLTVQEPDFTLSRNGGAQAIVLAGQTATYSFTVTPTAPATFADAVTFTCAFENPDPTLTNSCSATPVPAGNGSTSVTLSIKTAGPNIGTVPAVLHRADKRSPWLPLTVPVVGVALVGLVRQKVSRQLAVAGLCASLTLLGLLIACGGGGSSPITVSVAPGSASLFPNVAGANNWPAQTTTFTATVDNTAQKGVSWSISPASAGSIDSNGKYTAPATVPSPATVTVTATSMADASKTGTARITIQTPTALGTNNVTVTATEAARPKPASVTLTVQ